MSASLPSFKQVYVEIPPLSYHSPSNRRENASTASSPNRTLSTPTKRKFTDNGFCVEIPILSAKKPKLTPVLSSSNSHNALASGSKKGLTAEAAGGLRCHQCRRKNTLRSVPQLQRPVKSVERSIVTHASRIAMGKIRRPPNTTIIDVLVAGVRAIARPVASFKVLIPLGTHLSLIDVTLNERLHRKLPSSSLNTSQLEGQLRLVTDPQIPTSKQTRPPAAKPLVPKPKALPLLQWSPIDTTLTRELAEERFHIREFILRFGVIFSYPLSKAHLEELNEVDGRYGAGYDDDDEDDEGAPLVGWISDGCAKAIIVGLLGLLVDCYEEPYAKVIKSAARDIRASGTNLTKMWGILAKIRDSMPEGAPLYPDPPRGPSAQGLKTRALAREDESQNLRITSTAQLIPIISSLQEAILTSQSVRKEIDEGIQEGKDWVKTSREAIRKEKEDWENMKAEFDNAKPPVRPSDIKAARTAHTQRMRCVESSLKVLSFAFAPRSGYLGRDPEGRSYWGLSPDLAERESAMAFLQGRTSKQLKNSKMEDARNWSSFVAVWGSSTSLTAKGGPSEDKWWCIREPAEVRKLCEWLKIKYPGHVGFGNEETWWSADGQKTIRLSVGPTKEEHMALIKGLEEYASLMEFRMTPTHSV
ncbi:hypothetical protein ONZ45_g6573 [Pleurotus djamor]|nr:hypothetical protein ONZ45_g6573 [Pleurotus djamor]